MTTTSSAPPYLAGQVASPEQIQAWVDTFHQQGCLFLENVLPPEWCAQMRVDLDWALEHNPTGLNGVNEKFRLAHRMFETSPTNLKLFDLEPIVSLAEALIAPNCHVFHNNSFQSLPGGGIDSWHQGLAPPAQAPHRKSTTRPNRIQEIPTYGRANAARLGDLARPASFRRAARHAGRPAAPGRSGDQLNCPGTRTRVPAAISG